MLLQNGNLVDESKIEKALEIISETWWDGYTEASRLQGYTELHTSTSNGVSKKNTQAKPAVADENASYSSLVESSGF